MHRYLQVFLILGASALVAYLWASLPPESLQKGLSGITEDAQFALTVRLTGFIVLLTVAFFFAIRNIRKDK
ncbi:MAG TPA: hypothetical protein PLR20_06750 [Syntrophales bacterium]|nr:hypothetical protein [Syntrophales bacterium]HOX94282.1 hypothetical protein [Syntrophales bacterium]HPI56216.1 hypothetical protein [Syntrophales bacterium]HPN24404.1 hypothetical protein [Syntrophales bacterium]HQM29034.1 hypothetical protein [Syntrophales bacterium]